MEISRESSWEAHQQVSIFNHKSIVAYKTTKTQGSHILVSMAKCKENIRKHALKVSHAYVVNWGYPSKELHGLKPPC